MAEKSQPPVNEEALINLVHRNSITSSEGIVKPKRDESTSGVAQKRAEKLHIDNTSHSQLDPYTETTAKATATGDLEQNDSIDTKMGELSVDGAVKDDSDIEEKLHAYYQEQLEKLRSTIDDLQGENHTLRLSQQYEVQPETQPEPAGTDSLGTRKIDKKDLLPVQETNEQTSEGATGCIQTGLRKEILDECFRYGSPIEIIEHLCHICCYDNKLRICLWAAYVINKKDATSLPLKKNRRTVQSDPAIDASFATNKEDYTHTNHNMGHMLPVNDAKKISRRTVEECCLMSNIVPQNVKLNKQKWVELEEQCHTALNKHGAEWAVIITGIAMIKNKDGYVVYKVFSEKDIAIPTHLYKILAIPRLLNGECVEIDYDLCIVPNEPVGPEKTWQDFREPLETLTPLIGVKFFTENVQLTRTTFFESKVSKKD